MQAYKNLGIQTSTFSQLCCIAMTTNYNKMNAATAAQPSGPPLGDIGCGAAGDPTRRKRRWLTIPCIVAVVVLMVCAIAVPLHFRLRDSSSSLSGGAIQPTQAIVMTCRLTQYPSLCIDSLASFPGALSAKKSDLVRISVNMTLQHVQRAHSAISVLAGKSVSGGIAQQAIDDCGELLEDSMDQLSRSISAFASHGSADVMTWLSAALTNQDTCREGIGEGVQGEVRDRVQAEISRLEEITSNSLAMFAAASGGRDFSGVPIQNRRLLSDSFRAVEAGIHVEEDGFPAWLNGVDRKLLTMEMKDVDATIRVASDGSGTYRTIQEAVDVVPEQSNTRTVIYVKAGRYQENVKVGRKQWNVMIVGDGKASTVVSGSRSVQGGYTTFHTATFAATGFGFIARDITFENTAGPDKHQAVALRVGGDHSVIYRCSIISYQDTLYVHSQRQFFRECDIYGTVDFIFGNAAVVIQKSNIVVRRPMSNQKNTITAQNRKDPNQNTGMSIHECQILASQDLNSVKSGVPTYLGRPWKMYLRVVFMLSYMGDHINPQGWLPWSGNFALDTLFYGEYMNYGPGAAIGKRVQWRGYRVITSAEEANKFTVGQFIYGTSWLPSTGVAYVAGLS